MTRKALSIHFGLGPNFVPMGRLKSSGYECWPSWQKGPGRYFSSIDRPEKAGQFTDRLGLSQPSPASHPPAGWGGGQTDRMNHVSRTRALSLRWEVLTTQPTQKAERSEESARRSLRGEPATNGRGANQHATALRTRRSQVLSAAKPG